MSSIPRVALFLSLLVVGACSTALAPYSEFDDEVMEGPAPGRLPDAALGAPDAARPPVDAGFPRDAMTRPPDAALFDAGPQPRDAGSPRDAGPQPRDAGSSSDASSPRDAGLARSDAAVFAWYDAGTFACSVRTLGTCPATEAEGARCPLGGGARLCVYPTADNSRELIVHACSPALGTTPQTIRVPCSRNCLRDVPSGFEELDTNDCASRPVTPCDQLITDQQTADFVLEQAVQGCGFTSYHFAVIFSRDGCVRALAGREILDPQVKCIGQRLGKIRLGCALDCAAAISKP